MLNYKTVCVNEKTSALGHELVHAILGISTNESWILGYCGDRISNRVISQDEDPSSK